MFYTQKLGKIATLANRKCFRPEHILENSPLNSASYGVEIVSLALTVPEILDQTYFGSDSMVTGKP